jgi:transcriptional regulator with PAS, ATPase and Fis domain
MEHVLIGNHLSIQKIRELIGLVSDTGYTVLLQGETGTGKEVVARLLHASSPRRDHRFVKINCAALPLTLLESELFGHEKGAFTGADKFKPGKFELASEGVIFLDEIGDMPMVLQAKLLHVLQSGEFSRLGGTGEVKVNAWTIACTNHDLEKDIQEGLFREDLYYRLNIIKIELPPLREIKEDIPILTEHFVEQHRRNLEINEPLTIDSGMKELFQAYHWPGNVRELSSIILRLMLGSDPETVKTEMLSGMASDGLALPMEFAPPLSEGTGRQEKGESKSDALRSLKDVKIEATRFIEKKAITHALNMTGWNKREAAKILKISYKALFYKIDEYEIRTRA